MSPLVSPILEDVQISPAVDDSLALAWSPREGVSGYVIEQCPSTGAEWTMIAHTETCAITLANASLLEASQLRVRAIDTSSEASIETSHEEAAGELVGG